jgi:hypothetical protein
MDWIGELEAVADLSAVQAALEAVSDGDEYIEAPVGSTALAAAEVVAALRGRAATELPEEVSAWISAHPQVPDAALIALAERTVAVIGEDEERSELRQLWDEAAPDDQGGWRASVADLRQRLR